MGDSPRVCPSGLGQSRSQPGPGAPRRRPRGLRPHVLGAKALSLRQRKVERLMKGRERYIFPSLAKFEVFLYYPEFFFFLKFCLFQVIIFQPFFSETASPCGSHFSNERQSVWEHFTYHFLKKKKKTYLVGKSAWNLLVSRNFNRAQTIRGCSHIKRGQMVGKQGNSMRNKKLLIFELLSAKIESREPTL